MVRQSLLASMILALGLVVAGCGPRPETANGTASPAALAATAEPEGYPGLGGTSVFRTPEAPALLPTPEAGQAVLGGALYSFTSNMLVGGTLVYLTPGVGPDKRDFPLTVTGPDEAKGDIRGQTNQDGQFVFTNVPPGNYFLVAASFTWSYGVAQAGEETPLLIDLQADQAQSVGVIYVSWP